MACSLGLAFLFPFWEQLGGLRIIHEHGWEFLGDGTGLDELEIAERLCGAVPVRDLQEMLDCMATDIPTGFRTAGGQGVTAELGQPFAALGRSHGKGIGIQMRCQPVRHRLVMKGEGFLAGGSHLPGEQLGQLAQELWQFLLRIKLAGGGEFGSGERLWELKLSKYGGWDVFSINDQVLAVLGGDDLPPGPLPPRGMPLGVSFCARHSLTGLPATTRITELLIQCENALSEGAPQVICQMKQLQALQLSCRESFLLPAGLPGGLRKLDLRLFRGKLTPGSLESLTCLEELHLSETASSSLCSSETSSMALPGSLRRLILQVPRETAELGFLRGLHQLQELELRGSAVAASLEPLAELHELEELSLHLVSEARDLNPLRGLKQLRRLSLGGMSELVNLSPIACLPNLRDVTLILCDALSDVSPLAQLPSLRRLMLMDCDRVHDVSALESIPGLEIQR